jgi:rod shape determining protein RodA
MSSWGSFFERFDWVLLTAVMTLTAIGLTAIYGISISQSTLHGGIFTKQLFASFLGLSLVIFGIFFDYRHLRSWSFVLYLLGAALLIAVLVFGQTINGTQGWFRLFGLSFQPVEISKLCLILYLSAFVTRRKHGALNGKLFFKHSSRALFTCFSFSSSRILDRRW